MSDANNNSGNNSGTPATPIVIPQSGGYTITLPTLSPGNVIVIPQGQWIIPAPITPSNPTYPVQYISVGNGWTAAIDAKPAEASAEAEPKEEEGYTCRKCDTYCEMVKPNQEDGTYICWKCRHGY
jgi:hypothetical protein